MKLGLQGTYWRKWHLCVKSIGTSMTKDESETNHQYQLLLRVSSVISKFASKFISKFDVKNFRISPWKNGEPPILMTTYSLMKMKPLRMRMSWCQMQIVNFLLQIQTGKVQVFQKGHKDLTKSHSWFEFHWSKKCQIQTDKILILHFKDWYKKGLLF